MSDVQISINELNGLRKVYILDFGMCRKFTDAQGLIRKRRVPAGFRGTVRYASISCLVRRELCRKNDVEEWVYIAGRADQWTPAVAERRLHDRAEHETDERLRGPCRPEYGTASPGRGPRTVGEYTKRCRQEPHIRELFDGCPPEYAECIRYCDSRITGRCPGVPYKWEKPSAPAGGGRV
ncbi:CK1/WORM6 protein kinase [Aphelenchoides avenae]|nr:CK1/WORM6 protein kinase [Aphelenchus avenae]